MFAVLCLLMFIEEWAFENTRYSKLSISNKHTTYMVNISEYK